MANEKTDELRERFEALSSEWKKSTAVSSSAEVIGNHPAYRAIVAMGPAVVPLIIASLERELDHWFWALTELTGADPVPPESYGNLVVLPPGQASLTTC